MIESPHCPICESSDWETLGSRTWRQVDLPKLTPVIQRRLRVLYEVWKPGCTEFTARSELCRRCGFVIYAPRPTADEIDAKYRFLTDLGPDASLVSVESKYNQLRVTKLFEVLAPHLPRRSGNRILDFGGGDGRLLRKFADRGDQCFAVDYVKQPVSGVTKLADTLAELAPGEKFDGVIASHVLEHVADPLGVLKQLVERLEPKGRIYVELPMEIWRKPPLHEEPVTHVNFFTAESTRYMMAKAGLNVLSCRTEGLSLPGVRAVVIRAVGEIAASTLTLPTTGARAAHQLLRPGLLAQLQRVLMHPEVLHRSLTGRVRKLFGAQD